MGSSASSGVAGSDKDDLNALEEFYLEREYRPTTWIFKEAPFQVIPGIQITPKLVQIATGSLVGDQSPKVAVPKALKWYRGPKFRKTRHATQPMDVSKLSADQFELLTEGESYSITDDDVMRILKIQAVEEDGTLIYEQPVRVLPRPDGLPLRKMVPVIGAPADDGTRSFSIMSYNVLSKLYGSNDQFPYVPQYCLEWDYRQNTIRQEIADMYLADIVCLQECEDDDYQNIYLPALEAKGMIGTFRKRPGLKHDGCAVFYNKDKFRFAGDHGINFDNLDDVQLLKPFKRGDYFNTNNIAHVVMLEHLLPSGEPSGKFVCAVTPHLFWDPAKPAVKLLQAKFLLDWVRDYQVKWRRDRKAADQGDVDPANISLIVCGDFNSLPGSAVYEIFAKGKIQRSTPAAAKYNAAVDWVTPYGPLQSVYQSVGEPDTNISKSFIGCLDYIWCEPSKMNVLEILQNPFHDEAISPLLLEFSGLPNPTHGSDHIPLKTKLSWK